MSFQRISTFVLLGMLAILGLVGMLGVIPSPVLGVSLVIGAFLGGWLAFTDGNDNRLISFSDNWEKRFDSAQALRATRERERAFYEITSTLSSTLDYQRVLDAVQDIGELIVRENTNGARLVSAALLFRSGRKELQVASARGLTRADSTVTVPGEQGVLGLALKQSEPVFSKLPRHDPEVKYFSAFGECNSILAIPLRASFNHYGVLLFGSTQDDAFSEDHIELLKAIGTQATIALQNAALYQNLAEEKERIVAVDEDARKKLARDLHDGPTQSIAAIAMRINYVRRLIQNNADAHGELGKVEDLARRTTKEIRHMLFTLRPLILETQGLVAALDQLADKMRDTHNLNVIIEAQQGIERWIDHNAQGVVFYIIEEAVNNARKHAQAPHIWVRLQQRDNYFIAEIEDDGVGFDQSAVEEGFSRNSLGMVNMRERTELVEGTLHLDSKAGVGTKISVVIPIRTKELPETQEVPAASSKPKKPTRLQQISQNPSAYTSENPVTNIPLEPVNERPADRPSKSIPHAGKRSPST